MKDPFNVRLSRRQFLRASALAAGVAAVSGPAGWVPTVAADAEARGVAQPGAAARQPYENVWIPTTCMSCAPHVKCGLLVHRVNGVAVRIVGNPAAPFNQGKVCARTNSMISQLYSPYRVKYPVKRTNPERGRGVDPKWVEISWEEAFNTVAQKLRQVRADDPRKLMLIPGHVGTNLLRNFATAFGTPNVVNAGTATFCGGGSSTISSWLVGEGHGYPDMARSKYVISFGAQSIQGSKGTPRQLRDYIDGKDQGVRVVNVSPMVTASTAKADEWVPLNPGTVIPFCLSMAHVLVNEMGTYDVDFLKGKTNAPYLIGPDGKYVRDNSVLVDDKARGKVGKPLVWDSTAKVPKVFDDPTLGDVALEGAYTVNGVQARTAFELLKAHVAEFPPEKSEALTGVPADTVRRLAREWADNAGIGKTITIDGVTMPYRPVAAIAESGAKGHIDTDQIVMAAYLLCELVGAIGVPGGMNAAGMPNLSVNPADGIVTAPINYSPIQYPSPVISQNTLYPTQGSSGALTYLAMTDPAAFKASHVPTVLGFQGGNAQQLGGDPETINESFKKFDFIFAVSLVFDEPTEQADIVFPESSWLERYNYQAVTPHGCLTDADRKGGIGTSIYQPVVDTVFDTKNGDDIWLELARRVGIAEGEKGLYAEINKGYGITADHALPTTGSDITWTDVVDRVLRSKHGDEHGLDWFKENGILVDKPVTAGAFYGAAKFPKAKFPIYYEEYVVWRDRLTQEIKEKGISYKPSNDFVLNSFQPLPTWREHPEHTAPATHPLYAINFKIMELFYGNIDQPWLNEWAFNNDPYATVILVNPATAAGLGLKDGEQVEAQSYTGGKTRGQVKLTNLVMPNLIAIGGAWGARSVHIYPGAQRGPHFNSLWKISPEFLDPLRGGLDLTTRAQLVKV
jgi:anaerobic selenocysteine-containing dehydrogenase